MSAWVKRKTDEELVSEWTASSASVQKSSIIVVIQRLSPGSIGSRVYMRKDKESVLLSADGHPARSWWRLSVTNAMG